MASNILFFFTALQRSAPDRANVRTNFTAIVGGTAILDCPNKPGALLQYYDVIWTKDRIAIAKFGVREGFSSTDPRYNIDRSTFSLIISSVDITDSGEGYWCDVYVRNPSGIDNERLPPHSGSITLHVTGEFCIYSTKLAVGVIA